jgi:hypothetical protein
MAADFFQESISIADGFIKSLCFIDDQPIFNNNEDPLNEDMDHRLNANIITKVFAPHGKSCSFYQYQKLEEEQDIIKLANCSDVNILDWRIILSEEAPITGKSIVVEDDVNAHIVDTEVDVKEKESRGKYALRLIEQVLLNNYDSPKLIIVFTAEYDAESIFNPIKEKLLELEIICDENQDELWFQNEKFRISIYFKASPKLKYLSDAVRNKILNLTSLPKIINEEFAKLTHGLVLSTALQCIAQVRSNTFLLLDSYNKNLDPAYLTHRALLPNSHDAEEHLVDIIGSDIKAILKGSTIVKKLREDIIPKYLDEIYSEDTHPFEIQETEKMPDIAITDRINQSVLKSIVMNGIEKTFLKKEYSFDQQIIFRKNCHKNLTATFDNNIESAKNSNIQFAILTTIKPKYQLNQFTLTQGTILKEENNKNYWLCIQPKCDSVRIETKKRAFIFLKLDTGTENNFHIVLNPNDPVFLKINYKIYYSKLIDFITDKDGNVTSFEEGEQTKFKKGDNLKMIWISELKNDFAQSVANSFSNQLSRVGLDLSEWLRRNSNLF